MRATAELTGLSKLSQALMAEFYWKQVKKEKGNLSIRNRTNWKKQSKVGRNEVKIEDKKPKLSLFKKSPNKTTI